MRQKNMYGFRHSVVHLNIQPDLFAKKKNKTDVLFLLGRKLSYDNDLTPSLVKIILNQAFKSCLVERQHP